MTYIESNLFLWLFISILCTLMIKVFRPMMTVKDNLKYADLQRQFAPRNFFFSFFYGEGFVFLLSIIGSVNFFFFSFGLSKKISELLPAFL